MLASRYRREWKRPLVVPDFVDGADIRVIDDVRSKNNAWSWAIPSPDGKNLALLDETMNRNAWLVEGQ